MLSKKHPEIRWPLVAASLRTRGLPKPNELLYSQVPEGRDDDLGPEYEAPFVGGLGPEVNEYVLVSLFQARFTSCKGSETKTYSLTSGLAGSQDVLV
ncbi:uncharacterized protein EAE97_000020 [Botrytis byssoidea]|uniref:Uncharacterized protein n=1 Tax=Botrytis byssoidea TaxID=139641 RepID=A0A9P5LZ58_9HELO|nr:uncharacterized protein EAE97_000020 [Botrytis byssoidea]KAF7954761.1 hypothetical protein EAE97_000020 [Botrytis byssoidea]